MQDLTVQIGGRQLGARLPGQRKRSRSAGARLRRWLTWCAAGLVALGLGIAAGMAHGRTLH